MGSFDKYLTQTEITQLIPPVTMDQTGEIYQAPTPQPQVNRFAKYREPQPQVNRFAKYREPQAQPAPSPKGKLASAYGERDAEMQAAADRFVAGQQGMASTVLQQGLSNASKFSDTIGAGISAITPDPIEQAIGKAAQSTINFAGKMPLPGGGTVGQAITGGLERFKTSHPEAYYNAKAAGQGFNLAGTAAMLRMVGNDLTPNALGRKFSSYLDDTSSGAAQRYAPIEVDAETLRKMAGAKFRQAERMGGTLPSTIRDKWLDDIQTNILAKTPEGQFYARNDAITKLAGDFEQFRGKPLDYNTALDIDKRFTKAIDGFVDKTTGKISEEGNELLQAQRAFRGAIEDAPETGAFQIAKEARKDWANSARVRTIENIIERAESTQNPISALQTGFRNLRLNKAEFNRYPKEAQKLIIHMAEGKGLRLDTARVLASRLIPMFGMSAGGPAGFLGGQALSYASRGATNAAQIAKAEQIAKAASGAPFKSLTMQEIRLLPPEQRRFYESALMKAKPAEVLTPKPTKPTFGKKR